MSVMTGDFVAARADLIARPGFGPTEGCIAVSPALMRRLLPRLSNRTVLRVLR